MSISIYCPTCGAASFVGNELAGKHARCPNCQAVFSVPAAPGGAVAVFPTGSAPPARPAAAPPWVNPQGYTQPTQNRSGSKVVWIILVLVGLVIACVAVCGYAYIQHMQTALVGDWKFVKGPTGIVSGSVHFRADHTYDSFFILNPSSSPGMRTLRHKGTWRVDIITLRQTDPQRVNSGLPAEWLAGRLKEVSDTQLIIATDKGDEVYTRMGPVRR